MNCEKYQSLPLGERSTEDQLVIQLAEVSYTPTCPRRTRLNPAIPVEKLAQVPWVPRNCRANPGMQPHDVSVQK